MDFGVLPSPRMSEPEVLAEFELLHREAARLRPCSKDLVERSRCELAAAAQEFVTAKGDVKEFSLEREHLKALRDLRMNHELIITRPDKGRATVIMKKESYVEKMMAILGDKSKFLTLGPVSEFDQTEKIEQSLRSFLSQLRDSKEITGSIFDRTAPTGSQRPQMYGLPKIHKPGEPLRPILSMCGSAQYDASKWLCEILKPVREYYGKRCVKDSFTFSDKIREKKLPLSGYMCSFDVVSLFTNVPLEEVINICADALYRNDDIEPVITTLTESSFKELMRLVTSGVEFSFNGTMFRQIDGVAMGSPLGPTLANIFVGFFEKKIPADEWPLMYDRYVDDVFSFFVSKAKSAEFFERLNSLHPALRFTVEGEENGSLPFLDVRATKTASGIVTSIFRKPTFTGLYTPWDSFSPTVYKVNLVRSLAHRIIRICSPTTVEGELTALRDILAKNGYPGELLDRFVTTDQPTRREGPRPCPLTLRVPWLGSKTEKLVRRANDAVRLAYPAGEVRAVYRTNKAFNLPKDRIPTQSQSNLIYQFECRQCGSRYVGKTAQRFVDRISQHVPKHILDAVLDPQRKRPGRPPKKRDNPAEGYQSTVACHLAANADCCRSYRESDFTVLSRCRSKQHRDVLEAMYIRCCKPVLCGQKSFVVNLTLFRHTHSMHS